MEPHGQWTHAYVFSVGIETGRLWHVGVGLFFFLSSARMAAIDRWDRPKLIAHAVVVFSLCCASNMVTSMACVSCRAGHTIREFSVHHDTLAHTIVPIYLYRPERIGQCSWAIIINHTCWLPYLFIIDWQRLERIDCHQDITKVCLQQHVAKIKKDEEEKECFLFDPFFDKYTHKSMWSVNVARSSQSRARIECMGVY